MRSSTITHQRLITQRLIGAGSSTPEAVVGWFGAVQAQDYAGAKWALGQRVKRCTDADVDRAIDSGSIVRTHVLRPTWHFVAPQDLRWMLALSAPRVHAANAYYYRLTKLDERTFAKSEGVLRRALSRSRYATRVELGKALDAAGIDTSGLRLGALMMHAELEAVICNGPRRGKQFTYALFDERVPKAKTLSRKDALAALTLRYFASHGPAQIQDFVWWSGLTVADAKAAVELVRDALEDQDVDGKRYFYRPERRRSPGSGASMRLLPNYDEYLVAYKDRELAMERELLPGLGARNNVLSNHLVLSDGRVIGSWRRTLGGSGVTVETRLLRALDDLQEAALSEEIERYGEFLEMPVVWKRLKSSRG